MTVKVDHGHWNCRYSIGHMTYVTSYSWCLIAVSLSCTVSEILPLYNVAYVTACDLEKSFSDMSASACLSALCVPWCKKALYKYSDFPFLSVSIRQLTLQATFAFRFICKHTVYLIHFPRLTSYKGFSQQKWHSRSFKVNGIGDIRWVTYDFLQRAAMLSLQALY